MAYYADSYSRLEDAIKAMMQAKANDPASIAILSPANDDLCSQWDASEYVVVTSSLYTNIPGIYIYDNDEWYDKSVLHELRRDSDGYVAKVVSQIGDIYSLNGDEDWTLTFLEVPENNRIEDVWLAIESQHADNVEAMIRKYNKECSEAGFKTKLSLDRKSMVIAGGFVEKDSNLFSLVIIKSQNKEAHKAFRSFLLTLVPYLCKLQ